MKSLGDKPMMSDKEIKIIDDLIEKRKPKLCLEWGSGASTTYFPKHNSIDLWLAIEHDGNVLDLLYQKFPKNVQTIWITNPQDYADCMQRSHQKFDLILIDGLEREKCLENALEILAPGGIALLHDAGRAEYQEFIEKHNGEMLSEGEIPDGDGYAHRGLALFRSPYGG